MTYEELLNNQQLENIKHASLHSEDEEYREKIIQLSKLLNIPYQQIVEEGKKNLLVAYSYAKNAKKQNIIEPLIEKKLKKKYDNVEKMISNGKESIRFDINGNIVKGRKNNISTDITKSVDFKLTINGKIYYLTQKYTCGEGGAQDNQFEDIKKFISWANNNKNRDYGIGAIIDGSFFTEKRIDFLKNEFKDVKDFIIIQTESIED